ncbi:MAG: YigZ family protein [Rikenellaceae bacterium]|nr:YigZ family protein [Rikenellaceae bacterium]
MASADSYKTIREPAEGLFKDKGSRFISYSYHVETEEQVKEYLSTLKKKYYDATHHCYAWRLGPRGALSRANDDGEPSGSAGKPILGQLLSYNLTDILVVVIRYFGGTLLGVPGLINAYRAATVEVLENSQIITLTEEAYFEVLFPYLAMNDVMKIVKIDRPRVVEQSFDNLCRMVLAVPCSEENLLAGKLNQVDGAQVEFMRYK